LRADREAENSRPSCWRGQGIVLAPSEKVPL